MDRLLIDQKLETLRHCLTRVAGKCPPDTALGDLEQPDLYKLVRLQAASSRIDRLNAIGIGAQGRPDPTAVVAFEDLGMETICEFEMAYMPVTVAVFLVFAIGGHQSSSAGLTTRGSDGPR